MHPITITCWLADGYEAQVDAVLTALDIEFHRDDPDAGFSAALELGLVDGDVIRISVDAESTLGNPFNVTAEL